MSSFAPEPSLEYPLAPESVPDYTVELGRGLARMGLVGLITGIVLGATTALFGVCVIVCLCQRKMRKQKRREAEASEAGELLASSNPNLDYVRSISLQRWNSDNKYTFEELAKATDNFADTNLLGQGGFGFVHKGLLPDGTAVAIKQLKAGSRQGEREFQAEIRTISRVHHRHLVSLLGYCVTRSQRFLIYEFVSNKTLEFHLHEKGRPVLEWPKRLKIALGAAKGLAYLHEDCKPKTIHRDVKTSNILIDDSFEAKLADFGLARPSSDTDTHVSTRVMGTFGYMDPEYGSTGNLTAKSDVFSFGVVLLELIVGRRPIDKSQPDDIFVYWAKPRMVQALNDGSFDGLVDPRLEGNYDVSEMTRMVACADASVHQSGKCRPKMSQIVRALEGNLSLDELTEGASPVHSTIYNIDGSGSSDSEC